MQSVTLGRNVSINLSFGDASQTVPKCNSVNSWGIVLVGKLGRNLIIKEYNLKIKIKISRNMIIYNIMYNNSSLLI